MKNKYQVIGLMSGTSLDGLDIAHCTFNLTDDKIDYHINAAETVEYTEEWTRKLRHLHKATALEFCVINKEFGHYMGRLCKDFIDRNGYPTDLVGSHGHTIFHEPARGFTVQIGSGAALAVECGVKVACDFRSLDVALGGQGAPLVPIGDQLLFGSFDACLNIGGFSNISFDHMGTRIAFDIGPANFILNHYAELLGKPYDENGNFARSGKTIPELFHQLNQLEFYAISGPKSLGREWIYSELLPITDKYADHSTDLLATLTQHIAFQISRHLPMDKNKNVLATGGGVLNNYLIECLQNYSPCQIVVPDEMLIKYKEALVFALLGLLRFRSEINCLASVTGACYNNIGGALWLPPEKQEPKIF